VQLVRAWLEYHGKKCNAQDIGAAVEAVARRRSFNPVQDMLRSLEWDGTPRLDRVLPAYFQSPDTAYERAIGPRWFISLVARAMTPGCQSDCTLVLEGRQGRGKTSTFRALMRDPGWYAESSCGVDAKDFLENLRGVWLMGFDELDSLARGSLTKVKTTLTRRSDKYRKSYGRRSTHFPRACGFCGSTNGAQYLNDPTGARRFWPVKMLREIDVGRIECDRDQIWAEAFAHWNRGEPWHVDTPELLALCEAEQEARYEVDGWEERIQRWLNDPTKFSRTPVAEEPGSVFRGVRPFDGSQGVTTADVLEHAVGKLAGQWTTGDAMRVGKILQHRLGMDRTQVRVGDGREWRYVFPGT
jgi:putative DNA primase/helicase